MIHESSNYFLDQAKYFWKRRELVFIWTKFNLIASYSQTKLGLIWIFLQPLLTASVYTIAFTYILGARPARGEVPYLAFYLSGTFPWQLFNDSVMRAGQIVISNMGLMTQVRFPREASVFVSFSERIVDFGASFLVTVIVLVIDGIYPNINYLYIPIWLLIVALFSLGSMFILSCIGVVLRDLPQIISPIMRFMFFMSGVIFSLDDLSPTYQKILRINPIVWIIEGFRDILLYNERPNLVAMVVLLLLGLFFFLLGYWFFKSKEAIFTEYI